MATETPESSEKKERKCLHRCRSSSSLPDPVKKRGRKLRTLLSFRSMDTEAPDSSRKKEYEKLQSIRTDPIEPVEMTGPELSTSQSSRSEDKEDCGWGIEAVRSFNDEPPKSPPLPIMSMGNPAEFKLEHKLGHNLFLEVIFELEHQRAAATGRSSSSFSEGREPQKFFIRLRSMGNLAGFEAWKTLNEMKKKDLLETAISALKHELDDLTRTSSGRPDLVEEREPQATLIRPFCRYNNSIFVFHFSFLKF
uniref:Uncharacterized protein n=1 Tax=Macrostomum lignano TaxID=282301 RepID=A0A1I8HLH2_9PLAT